jgi:methylthioribose-1-phosphate isomerase
MIDTMRWNGRTLQLLDQTRLPLETIYVDITDERQTWDAIKRLVVRGAPAIGVAAAFGVYLGVRQLDAEAAGEDAFFRRLDEVGTYLKASRPTAVNLAWAVDRVIATARTARKSGAAIPAIQQRMLDEAIQMLEEDRNVCRSIGEHGVALLLKLKADDGVIGLLTHCNAGSLATVAYGTALAPIYVGAERGMRFHVFADETRPLLQGSRITAYELRENGIPVTVICDNMAATVMQQGKVKAVIVGTDRVAANGDVANKIGTLSVAILARHFGIPFYVAAPTSSIDLSLSDGGQIPIEQRDGREITEGLGRATAPPGVDVYNPAFDVTPHELVTAIITERGVIFPPYRGSGMGVSPT